ncbi:concanavalin A-like lectin/glucanase superfamily protein [Lacibacter cauensis]|uniref:Concanavalin A-like lectin/glucanase superfamily protein n=1 Tax=Lacibacter cauensis TaxID=510947 RepID=A0A562SSZ3_9BACT|nr:LamG-like jellyroll fold domain-containing protein [Lacibacter cauensis]TWI83900.1 concanavalin A-like lectin/glucanase superfamily protein [Lacibacter cauensis]
MKLFQIKQTVAGALLLTVTALSCKPDGNPNNLPSVNPADYAGKIDGFNSSDEIFPDNLIAYWSFDDTKNELKSGTAPGSSAGDSYVTDAVRGKSLSLTAGYLYFPTQFQKFKTDTIKSWSISTWIKIRNNGSKRTMLFQLARPGVFTGNINFALNTQSYNAANDSVLRIQPTFATVSGGTQDNVNSGAGQDKVSLNSWVHVILTYEYTTGVFNIWMNGVKVGNFPNRGTGNNSFKSYEPSEVIIGSNYNGIPGKSVSSDVTFAPMTGQVDELRIFNRTLPDAFIKALYNLGKANK